MRASVMNDANIRTQFPDREVNCRCGVGCQLTYQIKDDKLISVVGRDGPATSGSACWAASASTMSATAVADEAPGAQARRRKRADDRRDPANPFTRSPA